MAAENSQSLVFLGLISSCSTVLYQPVLGSLWFAQPCHLCLSQYYRETRDLQCAAITLTLCFSFMVFIVSLVLLDLSIELSHRLFVPLPILLLVILPSLSAFHLFCTSFCIHLPFLYSPLVILLLLLSLPPSRWLLISHYPIQSPHAARWVQRWGSPGIKRKTPATNTTICVQSLD